MNHGQAQHSTNVPAPSFPSNFKQPMDSSTPKSQEKRNVVIIVPDAVGGNCSWLELGAQETTVKNHVSTPVTKRKATSYPAGHIRSPKFTAINGEASRQDDALLSTSSPISASSTPTKKRKARGPTQPKTPAICKKPRVLNPTVEDYRSDGEPISSHTSTSAKKPGLNKSKPPKTPKSAKEPRVLNPIVDDCYSDEELLLYNGSTSTRKSNAKEPIQPKTPNLAKKPRVRSPAKQESLSAEKVISTTGSTSTSSDLLSPQASTLKLADLPDQSKKLSKEPSSPVISATITLPATPESIKKPQSLAEASPAPITPPKLSTTTKDVSAAADDKACLTPDSLIGTENVNLSSHCHSLTSPVGRSMPAKSSPPSPSTHIWILESSHPRLSWRRWNDQIDQPFHTQDVSGFFATIRKYAGITDVKQVEIKIVAAVQQWTFNVAWWRGQEFEEMKKFMLDQTQAAWEDGYVNIYVKPCDGVELNSGLDDSLYRAD